jgi:hypothetical protein
MSKFFVEYETGFWFFKRLIGMELVEAETMEKAYEKCSPRFPVRLIRQVNDDAQPSDFKTAYQIEVEYKHQEAMKKLSIEKERKEP